MRKELIITMAAIALCLPCSGCEKIHSASPEDGYNTDYAMSAVEYSIFLSKEISVIENALSTRMSMAQSVADGGYEASKEIQSTEEAIDKVSDAKDEITVTMPATTMEGDRQNLLDLTQDALNALETYKENLASGDKDSLEASAVELKGCFVAISGEANTYYQ